MARIYKVQVNLDEMNANLLGLGLEDMGRWVSGFQMGANGRNCATGMGEHFEAGHKAGATARDAAERFSQSQSDRAHRRWDDATALPTHMPRHCHGNATALPAHMPDAMPDACKPVTSNQYLETRNEKQETALSPDGLFEQFWDAYGRKKGRKETADHWSRMSADKRQKAIDGIHAYHEANPYPKFRLDPVRYLKRERWEDEPVDSKEIEPGWQKYKDEWMRDCPPPSEEGLALGLELQRRITAGEKV